MSFQVSHVCHREEVVGLGGGGRELTVILLKLRVNEVLPAGRVLDFRSSLERRARARVHPEQT